MYAYYFKGFVVFVLNTGAKDQFFIMSTFQFLFFLKNAFLALKPQLGGVGESSLQASSGRQLESTPYTHMAYFSHCSIYSMHAMLC